mgnify:FL=1
MKKIFFIPLLLLATACSKSDTTVENDSQIRFDLGFSGQTRVMANAFESGDVTGLYMTE